MRARQLSGRIGILRRDCIREFLRERLYGYLGGTLRGLNTVAKVIG
jgi:hypothetical protein